VVLVAALEKPPVNNPGVVAVLDGVVKENEEEPVPKPAGLLPVFPKLKPEEGEAAAELLVLKAPKPEVA
jgi:hypothetical protein